MSKQLNIVYFAWVKERLGRDHDIVDCPDGIGTIGELLEYLKDKEAVYRDVFSDTERLRFALDQDFVRLDATFDAAKELAIFPPVTGG